MVKVTCQSVIGCVKKAEFLHRETNKLYCTVCLANYTTNGRGLKIMSKEACMKSANLIEHQLGWMKSMKNMVHCEDGQTSVDDQFDELNDDFYRIVVWLEKDLHPIKAAKMYTLLNMGLKEYQQNLVNSELYTKIAKYFFQEHIFHSFNVANDNPAVRFDHLGIIGKLKNDCACSDYPTIFGDLNTEITDTLTSMGLQKEKVDSENPSLKMEASNDTDSNLQPGVLQVED